MLETTNISRSVVAAGASDRATLSSGVSPKDAVTGDSYRYVSGVSFAAGTPGFLGLTARNGFEGPALVNWDFSLRKDTNLPVLGEAGRIEFRAEFFNFLNHANFRVPEVVQVGLANTGQITRTVNQVGRNSQLALKLVF
jgi:hypothetical protein